MMRIYFGVTGMVLKREVGNFKDLHQYLVSMTSRYA